MDHRRSDTYVGGSGSGSGSGAARARSTRSSMATIPTPVAGLNQLPEEILCQILAPLLPLKWYSLSTLTALSETSSYLRTFLMQDDTLWHRALLGRAMGRPLHTIPGYAGFVEHDESLRKALDVVKGGGSAKTAVGAGGGAAVAASLMGLTGSNGGGTNPLPSSPTTPSTPGYNSSTNPESGQPNSASDDGQAANSGTTKLSKSQKKKLKEKARKLAERAALEGRDGGGGDRDGEVDKDGDGEGDDELGSDQEVLNDRSAEPHQTARITELSSEEDQATDPTTIPASKAPVSSDIKPAALMALLLPESLGPGQGQAQGEQGRTQGQGQGQGQSIFTSNGYLVPPPPATLPPSPMSAITLTSTGIVHHPSPAPTASQLPLRTLPPLTFRDLAMRIHSHEQRCVNCKVADSKLSHYYMTDEELRDAEKMGVNGNVVDIMSRICGGEAGAGMEGDGQVQGQVQGKGKGNGRRMWGEGKFVPARLDRVLNPKEAFSKAVRTAKFFVGYDFFGFCQYTLAIRIKNKSEPLTQPALARIEVIVFVPAKAVITITHAGVQLPPQEVIRVGAFVVENWGGVTLGDFQVAFERWVNEPMSVEETKLYETKCSNGRAKGKLHTRVAFIPSTYSSRFRMDETQRLYEIGDIRPLGNRVECGRAAILLGDRSASR